MAGLRLSSGFLGCFLFLLAPTNCKVDIDDFFPFGDGDSTVPTADDTFAGPIGLTRPFTYFNISQQSLFVNNNGAISFAQGLTKYTATCGALPPSLSMIAPFWADIDNSLSNGGAAFYREETREVYLQKAAAEIQAAFPNLGDLTFIWLFISTWDGVLFYGANSCKTLDDSPPRNTFQSILASDGRRSFVIFYYNEITWTTGTASGCNDSCTGLGGNPAKAGIDLGDGKTFYEILGSCTQDIVNIADHSNIGVPGKFIFKVDSILESPGNTAEPDCQKAENELFPDPRDCGKFFQCSHGVAYSKKCPANLHFNKVIKVCDWPKYAGCEL